jgi:hypothetical protein
MKGSRSKTNPCVLAGLALGLAAWAVTAQADEIPRGEVVPHVECKEEPEQSYALYLPSNYDPSRKWPLIFIYEPLARGPIPVELFKEGAEKYGFILIASNNSRNGPVKSSFDATKAMWDDSHSRFSINDTRLYAAGFSGGARMAMRLGLSLVSTVVGVIAVAGGLPNGYEVRDPPHFALFTVVGIRDFNYPEMNTLDARFAAWGIPHHLEVTPTEHQWPAKEICTRAIAWMELQAIRSGKAARDLKIIEQLYQSRLRAVQEEERAGKRFEAFHDYESLLTDFQGLRELSEVEAKVNEERTSAELSKLLKDEEEREKKRERLDSLYSEKLGIVRSRIETPQTPDESLRAAILDLEIPYLRKMAKSKDPDRSIIAVRVLDRIIATGYEDSLRYLEMKEPGRAVESAELCALAGPESPGLQFFLARMHAVNREKVKALRALEKAADLGLSNAERVEKEPAFDFIRDDPSYAETLARIRAHPAPAQP